MKLFKKYSIPYIIYAFIFIVIPILFIVFYSFTTTKSLEFSNVEISFDNFKNAFDTIYLKIIYRSVVLAVKTTIITFVIGYACAYFISNLKSHFQTIILVLFITPMWLNALLRTYAWKSILNYNGILNQILEFIGLNKIDILNTETAVLIGMVYNFLPFMIFPIYVSLHKIDKNLINAAKDLGCTKFQVFKKVIFPLSIPGVITGIIFVLLPSATSFIIPMYLGGGKVDTIGNIIEKQFTLIGNWNFGSMLSLIVLTLMLITTFSLNKVGEKYEK